MHWPIRRRRKQQGTQTTRATTGQPPAWPSRPLRPTIEPLPVDARQRAFVRGLTTRARIQVGRIGLAHAAEADAPSGRVDRLVVPVPARGESRLERLRERTLELLRPGRGRPEVQASPMPSVLVLPAVPAEAEGPRPRPREVTPALESAERSEPARASLDGSHAERAPVQDREAQPPPPAGKRPAYLRLLQRRAPQPRPDDAPAPSAPPAMRAPVEQRFGVDLSRVQVHRGPESAAAARRLRARAFTAFGHVHIPNEAGPLTAGPGRALLAHELVHAAQQQRGSSLPSEASSQGRALEEEAQRFERASGRAAATSHADAPAVDASSARDPARALLASDELAASASVLVSRLADGLTLPAGVQRAAEAGAAASAPTAPEPSLDEVVNQLYDQFSSRLRAELLVDRERAGALTDR